MEDDERNQILMDIDAFIREDSSYEWMYLTYSLLDIDSKYQVIDAIMNLIQQQDDLSSEQAAIIVLSDIAHQMGLIIPQW